MPKKLPYWDDDSPQLEANLREAMRLIQDKAANRAKPSVEDAREWHRIIMRGLRADDPGYVGAYRGEKGLEDVCVWVGPLEGAKPEKVADELAAFEKRLQAEINRLDRTIAPGAKVNAAQLAEVIRVCAWVHAEWVRIHPFANGNGRTARLWANSIALRYRVPAFVQLRPRPSGDYEKTAMFAMLGRSGPTEATFIRLYIEHIEKLKGA